MSKRINLPFIIICIFTILYVGYNMVNYFKGSEPHFIITPTDTIEITTFDRIGGTVYTYKSTIDTVNGVPVLFLHQVKFGVDTVIIKNSL